MVGSLIPTLDIRSPPINFTVTMQISLCWVTGRQRSVVFPELIYCPSMMVYRYHTDELAPDS